MDVMFVNTISSFLGSCCVAFGPKPTLFGKGVQLRLLCAASIELCAASEQGNKTLCVGLAFHNQHLSNRKTFCESKGSEKLSKKQQKQANQEMMKFKITGYDCVEIPQSENKGQLGERVYWYPGAVLPVSLITLNCVQCEVCREYVDKTGGMSCEHGHLICHDDMKALVGQACQPDAAQRYTDSEGKLRCPATDCKAIHNLPSFAARFPELFDMLLQHRMRLRDQRVRNETEAQLKVKMDEELKRIAALNAEELEVYTLKRDLENNVLTLRCPGCHVPFNVPPDFKECAALKCQTKDCRASFAPGQDRGFCGWCLQVCADKAHNHVAGCTEAKGQRDPTFPSAEELNRHLTARKKRLVSERLEKCSKAVRNRLMTSSPDLQELMAPPRPPPKGLLGLGFLGL
jgi:hypothetical protein